MNKKSIIITIAIFIVIVALFLLWRFVIGFKLTTESKFRNVVKNISDMSVYIVGNDDQRVEIGNSDDVNEILEMLSTAKVKRTTDLWIGGAYRIDLVNKKTNDVVKVIVHPVQVRMFNKVYSFCDADNNVYQKIKEILKKYIGESTGFTN
ncbi:MAG: hypothetical protein ACI4ON_06435 [Clostridia bacterium]